MRKPRALQPGDRIAVVAPASPFEHTEFEAGVAELRALGFEPVYEDSVFARHGYLAGPAALRAEALRRAWLDPSVVGVIAARGGYGSAQLLPLLDVHAFRAQTKVLVGYSDLTALQVWLAQAAQLVTFHGPMLAGRLGRGVERYDRDQFLRVLTAPDPAGEIATDGMEALVPGEWAGPAAGGNLTQLVASLGTPFAFDPPPGCVLFLEDVGERPYRIDRMMTQLRLSGRLGRAGALVLGTFEECEEPGGGVVLRDVLRELTEGFAGPVLAGCPFGHVAAPALTIPMGVRVRVASSPRPSLIIEEAAVS